MLHTICHQYVPFVIHIFIPFHSYTRAYKDEGSGVVKTAGRTIVIVGWTVGLVAMDLSQVVRRGGVELIEPELPLSYRINM